MTSLHHPSLLRAAALGPRVSSAVAVLGAVLLGPAVALASGGGGHAGTPAAINWWHWDMTAPPIGWFLLDFVVFLGLIVYAAKKPMREAFLRRHTSIKQTIHDNEAAHAEAERLAQDARAKLAAVEREVTAVIARIKEDGAIERERIIAAGRTYAERLRQDAQAFVTQESAGARERLRQQVAYDVFEQASAMLARELSAADRARLLEAAIVELEDATGGLARRTPVSRDQGGSTASSGGMS